LKLTDSTLDDLKAGFSLQNMPRTFHDAIWVTRRLGYSLLWIDSLCILQDSEEDWVREAASVADVYRNFVLTIAMLGAKESDQGCFGQRDQFLYGPCWLFADEEGHDEYVHPHLGDDDMSSSSSNKAPLRERV
jgi:Heterokaryon incompatibility protein (HET)